MAAHDRDREKPEIHAERDEAPSVDELVRLLESLVDDPEAIQSLDAEIHERLRVAAGRLALPDRFERRRFARVRRGAQRRERRERDDAALEATSNRARKRALAFPAPPPDAALEPETRRLLEHQARERETDASRARLDSPRACYVCKAEFDIVHHHYDSMCTDCASLNWAKRGQTADLAGRVALVTGARVKIGFEIAAMLLRAGARVIATTRFPVDAAARFDREAAEARAAPDDERPLDGEPRSDRSETSNRIRRAGRRDAR